MSISDEQLATEIVERLNRLLEDPVAADAIESVMRLRAKVPYLLESHPTIQVRDSDDDTHLTLSFLGLLNGIVGSISGGPKTGWGHIIAHFDGPPGQPQRLNNPNGRLLRFTTTLATPSTKEGT